MNCCLPHQSYAHLGTHFVKLEALNKFLNLNNCAPNHTIATAEPSKEDIHRFQTEPEPDFCMGKIMSFNMAKYPWDNDKEKISPGKPEGQAMNTTSNIKKNRKEAQANEGDAEQYEDMPKNKKSKLSQLQPMASVAAHNGDEAMEIAQDETMILSNLDNADTEIIVRAHNMMLAFIAIYNERIAKEQLGLTANVDSQPIVMSALLPSHDNKIMVEWDMLSIPPKAVRGKKVFVTN